MQEVCVCVFCTEKTQLSQKLIAEWARHTHTERNCTAFKIHGTVAQTETSNFRYGSCNKVTLIMNVTHNPHCVMLVCSNDDAP